MLGLVGYNFCADGNALDELPTYVDNITTTRLTNGIFDHYNAERQATSDYDHTIPTEWNFDTIMDADFAGNVNAGNIEEMAQYITEFKIKRRVKGTYDWITLRDVYISKPEDLSAVFTDNLNLNFTQYEYAFVPIMNDIEGNYVIAEVYSQFNGVFICDPETIYKFYAGVEYGDTDKVQQVGVFAPFGTKYPVVISNGLIGYQTGHVRGTVLPNDNEFMNFTNEMRVEMVKRRKDLVDFLTNHKAKIIKDWGGNAWLCIVSDNPRTSYEKNSGLALMDVDFDWVETGDPENNDDIVRNGLTVIEGERPSEDEGEGGST